MDWQKYNLFANLTNIFSSKVKYYYDNAQTHMIKMVCDTVKTTTFTYHYI
ncbi:MAG: hypothetical protein SOR57_06625 [Parabacteroides sp.]|nr:hypothetical protein [Parabacteroides sp.]